MLNDVSCEQRQFYYILTCMSFTSSLEKLLTFHLVCMCLCVSVMCMCDCVCVCNSMLPYVCIYV